MCKKKNDCFQTVNYFLVILKDAENSGIKMFSNCPNK
ncbi:MAG: hypothetical protein ACI85O_001909 [Saprospiraceae bacterium]